MSRRTAIDTLYVAVVTCFGAWLRLRQLGVPSFWLDEIIHYDAASGAASQSAWQWLSISQNENGPLFYATQLAGRVLPSMEASARIFPAVFGIAAIPLIWFAARALGAGRAVPYAAALLLALSPLHVYYSREARPYAMIVLIAMALLIALLRGSPIASIAALMLAAFYSTAVIAPFIVSAALAAILIRNWRFAAAAIACALLIAICYHPGTVESVQKETPRFATVVDSFSIAGPDVARPHAAAYVFVLLAIAGAVVLARRSRAQAIVVVTSAVLPALIPILVAWKLRPYFAVRYTITALPAYLLLVAIGIGAIASAVRADVVWSVVIAAALASQGLRAAMNDPFRKLDWRTAARTLVRYARPGDRIIAAHHWSAYCLGFYLREGAWQPPILDARGFPQPQPASPAWIVVAQDPNGTFTPWACRFPTLLASPIETFHLHYAGPPRDLPRRLDEAGGAYLDEISVWRAEHGRPLPANLDRARLVALLQRLSLEPDRAVAELTAGRVTLANLATTVAYDSVCDDDVTFLRTLVRDLFDREIGPAEMRDLQSQLQQGVRRDALAWRMGDSLFR